MALHATNGTHPLRSTGTTAVATGAGGTAPPQTPAEIAAAERVAKQILAIHPTLCVFLDTLETLIQDRDFKRSTYRFLLILFVEVEPANYFTGWSAHGLAKKYGMGYEGALNAWKLLLEKDWLRPVVNEWGRTHRYRLSPHLCWRGRPWKARIAQRNWDAERDLRALARQWTTPEREQP